MVDAAADSIYCSISPSLFTTNSSPAIGKLQANSIFIIFMIQLVHPVLQLTYKIISLVSVMLYQTILQPAVLYKVKFLFTYNFTEINL